MTRCAEEFGQIHERTDAIKLPGDLDETAGNARRREDGESQAVPCEHDVEHLAVEAGA